MIYHNFDKQINTIYDARFDATDNARYNSRGQISARYAAVDNARHNSEIILQIMLDIILEIILDIIQPAVQHFLAPVALVLTRNLQEMVKIAKIPNESQDRTGSRFL